MAHSSKRLQAHLDVFMDSFLVQLEPGADLSGLQTKFEEAGAHRFDVIAQPNNEEGTGPLLVVEMKPGHESPSAIEAVSNLPGVVYAEPNASLTAYDQSASGASASPVLQPVAPADAPTSSTDARQIEIKPVETAPTVATQPVNIEHAEDAPTISAMASTDDMVVSIDAVSNDTGYVNGSLWGMYGDKTAIINSYGSQAGEAWASGFVGTMKTVVGVVDTGIDYTHPDLYLNVWLNQGEISSALRAVLSDTDGDGLITFRDLNNVANASYVTDVNKNGYIDAGDLLKDARWADGADEDGNGYKDDLIGWDFANNDNDPFDDNGHGTHVSGTIGAMGGNGSGVVGVDWNVQIVTMKFMSANGSGLTSGAVQAINYFTAEAKLAPAAENFVATNNSWGGSGYSQALADAVTTAAKNDILFIAAAGNAAANNDATANYPSNLSTLAGAGYDAVISVASLTNTGALSSFSNYGATTVDLAAPGSSIYSTLPGGYGTYSGTSMATPYVTGAVALYAAAHPSATAAEIKAALLASVDTTPSLAGLTVTGGRLDIGNLLNGAPASTDIAGTLSTTAVLTTDSPHQSLIDVVNDQDWFKVSLTKGYVYTFAMDAAAGSAVDSYLRLLDSTGKELAVNDDAIGANARISIIANVDVTCFISAQAYQTTTGAYTLSMTSALGSLNLTGSSGADNLVGAAGNDLLTGLGGADTLDGGLGADTMVGGAGNDVYFVDNVSDSVVEQASEGTDTVNSSISYALTANVENLNLTGSTAINATGNALNNVINGNGAANAIDGGAGADTMAGGAGDDLYIVDNAGDVVIEATSAGTDTVNASVSYTLSANVENLNLTGSSAINGTGNTLNNIINGNSAANTIDGGAGVDTMAGGAGDDLYIVDNAGDVVIEATSAGTDTINASVSYTLSANVENLNLTGSSAINATGNALNNIINGNSAANFISGGAGDDAINGGLGSDTLDGGAGADAFIFNTALGPTNVDRINNFVTADDVIMLDHTIFTALGILRPLSAGAFNNGAAATQADDRIIYNTATGALLYDADGSGKGAAIQFATLTGVTGTLSASDFVVI